MTKNQEITRIISAAEERHKRQQAELARTIHNYRVLRAAGKPEAAEAMARDFEKRTSRRVG